LPEITVFDQITQYGENMPNGKQPQLPLDSEQIINDYRLAYRSRQASVVGRREVLSGKAKFGIFGDGKEVAQLAIAHAFQKGDWRSGYYRDQTWMFALGVIDIQAFFAQLYAHADVAHEPATAGRAMNGHFASRYINPDGSWRDQVDSYNIAADVSPTASQMPRLVGLAFASTLYRQVPELKPFSQFSNNGNEVAWGTIGNASTAEGMFWESVNAIGVLQAPAVITIYDDGFGISVPNQFQMVKENIGAILKGFERDPNPPRSTDIGYDLYTVRAWDYPALLETYASASEIAREYHIPAIVHVTEVTQPLGHSTSGSHERYKTAERLQWEAEHDCLLKMRVWMIERGIATKDELNAYEAQDRQRVEEFRKTAWDAYNAPLQKIRSEASQLLAQIPSASGIKENLSNLPVFTKRDVFAAAHEVLRAERHNPTPALQKLQTWFNAENAAAAETFSSHLHSPWPDSASLVPEVKPIYSASSPTQTGFEVVNAFFDAAFGRDPRTIAFGEDVGKLGDVNQGFRGLQEKYGFLRVMDTGIREVTILGQAIGLAMRGLRPICEIQYLDYLLYALQLMSDDLANLLWRTAGGQKAPVIIRTRGHRLEGIWHSGSPMAGIINLVRGIHVLVPRNLTQAGGFYNTLLRAEEPGLVIEPLNGYRLKERLPDNLAEMTVPLGVPEILRPGTDVTVVTYGSCCRIALDAAEKLSKAGIEIEVIDVQSLLPFDRNGMIVEALKKTNRVLFLDEDVPGGTTAYMLQQVIEKQGGYYHLDSAPRTLAAQPHRPAYGSDGDYWSKPNAETVFDAVYAIMHEVNPAKYPRP
jgi:pyruvate/2-oxoglutarate/acetoin dehydrogenase E1 component/TPP-dependent pyruvate/acetoin dehydrogenase alpha subunit